MRDPAGLLARRLQLLVSRVVNTVIVKHDNTLCPDAYLKWSERNCRERHVKGSQRLAQRKAKTKFNLCEKAIRCDFKSTVVKKGNCVFNRIPRNVERASSYLNIALERAVFAGHCYSLRTKIVSTVNITYICAYKTYMNMSAAGVSGGNIF